MDLFGMDGQPFFDAHLSIGGIILLGAYSLATLYALLRGAHQFRKLTLQRGLFLLVLVLLAFILSQALVLHPDAPALSDVRSPAGPGLALFALLPVLIAAIWLDTGPAILVGLAAGLGSAAWDSFRITQALEIALWAAVLSALLQQRYRGTIGTWLRQPLVASALSVLLIGWPLTIIAVAAAGPLSGLAGIEYALALVRPTLISFVGEALLAGLLLQTLLLAAPALRRERLQELVMPPWKRHLNRRMFYTIIPLATISVILLAVTTAFVAFRVSTNLIVEQMERDATVASGEVPFFVQTGHDIIGSFAEDEQLLSDEHNLSQNTLEERLLAGNFFQELIFTNLSGEIENASNKLDTESLGLTAAEEQLIQLALESGIPMESKAFGFGSETSAFISFATPVIDPASDEPLGVLLGRASLSANPFTRHTIEVLHGVLIDSGEGFIVDSNNTILLNPAHPERQLDTFQLENATLIDSDAFGNSTYRTRSTDGAKQIVHMRQVVDFPAWSVVIVVPNQVILELTLKIALPALALTLIMAGLSISIIMAVFRRFAEPLETLAQAAHQIASGQVDQSISVSGEGEVGRLEIAFESMRHKLKAQLDEQETLLEISYSASASLKLQRITPPILNAALDATDAVGARIVLRREDGSFQTFTSDDKAAGTVPMDKELVEHADLQGALVVSRIKRAEATLPSSKQMPEVKALIALPMRTEEQFHGILWLAYDSEHEFEQSEVNFLSSLANQASFAVANARLFEATEGGRRQLAAILSSTDDAVLVSDSKHRLLLLNPAAERVLDIRADAAIGVNSADIITQPELVALLEDTERTSASQELLQEDGTTLLAHASTIQGTSGNALGRVVLLSDITYLKELDELKSTFVNTVSHDLRAPLTYLSGYLTMMPMVGDLNDKQKDFVGKMQQGVGQMSELIDKLLRLGRLEAGVPLDLEACDVRALITECYESIYDRAQEQKISLKLELDDGLPHIVADSTLYRQAVMNLIENAVKYTPTGGHVVISASADKEEVTVTVKDSGPGISHENQQRLFEPFFRAKGKTAGTKGSGLGLAIVKGTADRHAGRVYVESELEKGSTFYLILPRRQSEKKPSE